MPAGHSVIAALIALHFISACVPPPPSPAPTAIDLTLPSATPGITLGGTLLLPGTPATPHPLVIFISGSGPQDRDETIFELKPFAILADALATAGIASLRLDDRGVGASGGIDAQTPIATAAADIAAAARFVASHPHFASRIDPARIGLIGHSEGSIVAALATAELASSPAPPRIAFVVSLAGVAVPILDLLTTQHRAILAPENVPPDALDRVVAANRAILAAIARQAPRDEVLPLIATSLDLTRTHVPSLARGLAFTGPETVYALNTMPRLVSFLAVDTAAAWRAVDVPVLAIGGSLDAQVDTTANFAAFRNMIPPERLTTIVLPGANHLLQPAITGHPAEYATLPPRLVPGLAPALVRWLRHR
jgi:alpha-beta hydrolase superfamily lysophospholipase